MYKAEFEGFYNVNGERRHVQHVYSNPDIGKVMERFGEYFARVRGMCENINEACGTVYLWNGDDVVMMFNYDADEDEWS